MNTNWTNMFQSNFNYSDHDAESVSFANSGGNAVLGGLLAANALNPATATSAAINLSPITQANVGTDVDAIADLGIDLL